MPRTERVDSQREESETLGVAQCPKLGDLVIIGLVNCVVPCHGALGEGRVLKWIDDHDIQTGPLPI